MPSDALSRREQRAKNMVFAKASSVEEHEQQGIDYWKAASAASKFQAIVELVEAGWYISETDAPCRGFDRSTHGTARLGS